MKQLKVTGVILVCIFLAQSADQLRFAVDKTGRSIQVDAFLLEWNEEDSDTINQGVFSFIWDAVNTPEGLAGYIWYKHKDTCSLSSFKMYPQVSSMDRYMTMVMDTGVAEPGFYAIEKSIKEGITSVTAEWLIPWDSIPIDDEGQYSVGLTATSSCEDTLKPITLSGKHTIEQGESSNLTTRITLQVISIAVLLAIFLMLRARAKKLQKR